MNEDKIIQMLLRHEEDIKYIKENMVTKEENREIMKILDKLVKLSEKKDQEVTMMAHGFARHGETIDRHDRDIQQIKPLVGLA